ncbi:MAG TPA: PfaD family polyunsaturated fatty acid/polyketide biosynthesis protein [Candidatus Angelobacter sp.]|jgi:trans-AT polyketide synthase/acyltransferase/oxidoreductase domain-containing protein|nr:PfaD family polyunsaturated fatty acid/polyketide biosynthesis protein [Candidatus Angelobacter sp.]
MSFSSNGRIIDPARLGSPEFRADYGVKYAYTAGAMYKAIASEALVVALAKAGLIGFFGTGGLTLPRIDAAIESIKSQVTESQSFGMNLLHNPAQPEVEDQTVDLFLSRGIRFVEASAYMEVTPSVVRYRLRGLSRGPGDTINTPHLILAKVSRPEVARAFMSPAPENIVKELVAAGRLTPQEAELGRHIPLAGDICVEADSGGHTDQGVAYALMPAMLYLRDEMMSRHSYRKRIRVGAAGGIGGPTAAAAAFTMGADFITTGSVNQCTVEAGISDSVKSMLQDINVQDTTYAPAGDMFELGAKVQVLKKGVLFPGRANKLYELYTRHNSLDEIDSQTRKQIEEKYFGRSFEDVWSETKNYYSRVNPGFEKFEPSPKQKMGFIFRWYFAHTTRLAMSGVEDEKVNYQVHCGPALGAFNQWVKGTALESWRNRHVNDIGERIMNGAAAVLTKRYVEVTLNDRRN